MWQLLDNRRAAADALEQEVASRSQAARRVDLQRQQLIDAVQGAAFLDRARSGRPTNVEIMDELSRRLPDTTYLEKLAVEDNRLTLIGLSTEASALVPQLEGSAAVDIAGADRRAATRSAHASRPLHADRRHRDQARRRQAAHRGAGE